VCCVCTSKPDDGDASELNVSVKEDRSLDWTAEGSSDPGKAETPQGTEPPVNLLTCSACSPTLGDNGL